jgi:hypothetical protein
LLEHRYVTGSVDKTLFTLNHGTDFFTCSDLRGLYHLLVALLTFLYQFFRK